MESRLLLKGMLWVGVLLLLFAQYVLWFGRGGLVSMMQLKALVEQQEITNTQLTQRNEKLLSHIRALREDPQTLEALARTEVGMIKPGEILYRVVQA